jgi:hypothetical protein
MKYKVTRFKSLKHCLKELEPFVRSGAHLYSGKPFARFGGMRSREVLANWLLCVAVNSVTRKGRLTFTSDPTGGDGIIEDTLTGETWPTEHILVPRPRGNRKAQSIENLILNAISRKQAKGGKAYASGKTLVVLLDSGGGAWFPDKVAKQLPEKLDFDAVWVVGLHGVERRRYVYNVTRLDRTKGRVPVWRVRIRRQFDGWEVK